MSEDGKAFRFQAFADAPAARAAFDAAYPSGSPIEAALQALVDMGAHCKAVGPTRFACRYVEAEQALAGFCWQLVIDASNEGTLLGVRIRMTRLGM